MSLFQNRTRLRFLTFGIIGSFVGILFFAGISLADHDEDWTSFFSFGDSDDHGNEATGNAAAWLFAVANFPVAVSIGIKRGLIPRVSEETQRKLRRFNAKQKRHLMGLHALGNGLASILAGTHFLLSRCVSTPIPEIAISAVLFLSLLGALMKFRLSPAFLRGTSRRRGFFVPLSGSSSDGLKHRSSNPLQASGG